MSRTIFVTAGYNTIGPKDHFIQEISFIVILWTENQHISSIHNRYAIYLNFDRSYDKNIIALLFEFVTSSFLKLLIIFIPFKISEATLPIGPKPAREIWDRFYSWCYSIEESFYFFEAYDRES